MLKSGSTKSGRQTGARSKPRPHKGPRPQIKSKPKARPGQGAGSPPQPRSPYEMVTDLIQQYNIPYEFDEEALRQAENLPGKVRAVDRKDRKDLRELFMVTIDNEDAKDLDDAVSLELLGDGLYRLGVHIADVTHYVKENSPLDRGALQRGTSVYLADRVIPMLPPKLSNGICSLNEGEDRLALSCIMDIDGHGKVLNYEILKTVIRVDHRMTYRAVDQLLAGEEDPSLIRYLDYVPFFRELERLKDILAQKRAKRGALFFDLAETKLVMDKKGRVTDIRRAERNVADCIIEEAMLVCNETVAEECFKRQLPFAFRAHEEPDQEKIEKLSAFLRYYGYTLHGKGSSRTLQRLLHNMEADPRGEIISRFVLRSMQQARYTPKNLGHYGLAAQYYCHFTSPIRRYPDLQIHRIIKESIDGAIQEERLSYLHGIMPEVCRRSSATERAAEGLERAVEDIKKAEYMAEQVGQEYEAVIAGVVPWGLYVELPNTVEGLIPLRTMIDDQYRMEQERSRLVGVNSKKQYCLGDPVQVRLTKVYRRSGNIDFVIV